MIVNLSFDELHEYVVKHYDKDLSFSYVAGDELKITFVQRVVITDMKVNVNLRFDEVKPSEITLTYNGGFALDAVIPGAINLLKRSMPALSAALTTEDNHRIRVDLAKIDKLKPVVDNLALVAIRVNEDRISIEANLK